MSLTALPRAIARRRVALLIAMALGWAGMPLLAAEPASAACSNPNDTSIAYRTDRCIGGVDFPARERLKAVCLTQTPAIAQIYPSAGYCGGSGRGAEAIAQARAVAWLNRSHSGGGVHPSIQWEVRTSGAERADITVDTGTAIEVYEAKLNTNSRNAWDQVDDHVGYLGNAGVNRPAVRGSSLANAPGGVYLDAFAIVSRKQCFGMDQYAISAYVAWLITPGVLHVYQFADLCFDPTRVPPPLPDKIRVPDEQGIPQEEPLEHIPPGKWSPVPPHTELPRPSMPCGPACSPVLPPIIHVPEPRGMGAYGDPHMATFDGLAYDFMALGEFQLVRSESLGLDVQMRTFPWGVSGSAVDRIALALNGYQVEIDGWEQRLAVDGVETELPEGTRWDLGDGAYLIRQDGAFVVNFPSTVEARPVLSVKGGTVQMWVPPGAGDVRGLLGDADGDRDGDLKTYDGVPLPPDVKEADLYRGFADGWRVNRDNTLFTYGAGQSTDDFTDRSHPSALTRLADLSDEVLAAGTTVCEQAGVADGPQFEDCILDWAITGDQAFVDAAAAQEGSVVEAGARGLDTAGNVSEGFDGDIAENFSSPRYGSGAGTGRFAGPFGRDGRYVFYVPDVVRSATAIDLKLLTLGTWSALEQSTVTVDVGGAVAWHGNPAATLAASASGVTAAGQPYTVYPLRIETGHRNGSLNVGVSAEIPLGASRAFAVDDVRVHADPTPTQVFDVSLPAAIEDGRPAAGAGRFETVASQDDYRFTAVEQDAPLLIDFAACTHAATVEWRLVNMTRGHLVAGGQRCQDTAIGRLAAGDYRLEVTSYGHTGTYKLSTSYVPPQEFSVALPVSFSAGGAFPGAGELETTASADVYRFTTSGAGSLRVAFSNCSPALADISWTLVSTANHRSVADGHGCRAHVVDNVIDGAVNPVFGEYELTVHPQEEGTYELALATEPSQVFDVSLPAVIADGSPAAGAGRLENTASSDAYRFTVPEDGQLQIDLSDCSPALQSMVHWRVMSEDFQGEIARGWGCQVDLGPKVWRGSRYRVVVDHSGAVGTYRLRIGIADPVQSFNLTLPATVSDGVPAAGAGNLETTTSQDNYAFSVAEKGTLRFRLSECSPSLGYPRLDWKLWYLEEDRLILQEEWDCSGEVMRDMPAGRYRLEVSRIGASGTYKLDVSAEAGQDFDVALPAQVSDGVPGAGAGRLERPASGDGYQFTSPGGMLHIDLRDCEADISWRLVWVDRDVVPEYGSGCRSHVTEINNGTWKLVIETEGNATGSYKLGLSLPDVRPDRFGLNLPATLPQEGVDYIGAANLETTQSEDIYRFYRRSPGPLQLDFSDCASTLGSVDYRLADEATDTTVVTGTTCSPVSVPQYVAEGWYELTVKRPGRSGTYRLGISAPPPVHTFDVALPLDVTDGAPGPGAGRLELDDSTDVYRFTLAAPGALQVDATHLSADLTVLTFDLIDRATGETVDTQQVWPDENRWGVTMEDLPAGDYELRVTSWGPGAYGLRVYVAPAPQVFDVTLPLAASDGSPAAGAGRLETTGSTDVYRFTKSGGGPLLLDVSNCATRSGTVSWMLVNEATGNTTAGDWWSCTPETVSWVNSGTYRLEVTRPGEVGTYRIGVGVPPQEFDLTLPATVSNNVPKSGAGYLETSASEDVYRFSKPTAGALQLDFAACSSGLGGGVDYRLTTAGGATLAAGTSCAPVPIANVPAGAHRLSIRRPGKTGSYQFKLAAAPPPDVSDVTLPATANGSLETTASEDVYRFTSAAAGTLQVDVSTCSSALGAVSWTLVNATSGATVASSSAATCAGTSVPNVPAGSYRLSVTRNGRTGTYRLALTSAGPQAFDLTLPAAVSNGVPRAGAGNLELATAEDQYRFTTTATGPLQVDLSSCSAGTTALNWTLVNTASGATVATKAGACGATTVPNVPAGSYRVSVTGKAGTYKLNVVSVPPQAFDVALPASISNGVPNAGAGNLEAAASEDLYRFSTTSSGNVRLAFSTCSSALGTVTWKLLNATTGATVASKAATCATTTVANVPAGSYRLSVTGNGKVGTYKVTISRA